MKHFAKLAFAAGSAVLVYLIVHFGYAPIAEALATLGFSGLLIVVVIHVPIIALMGSAWWAIIRPASAAPAGLFIWGRLIRDAAAEVLPFAQVGGYIVGARAVTIHGVSAVAAALSTVADLILELVAKLPYVVIGIVLLALRDPQSSVVRPIAAGLIATALFVVVLFACRRPIYAAFERAVVKASQRWPLLPFGDTEKLRDAFVAIFGVGWGAATNLALHFLAWVLGGVETWIMLRLIGVEVDLADALVIDSLFTALRSFAFFVPGAVGLQEAAYILVCGLFGIGPPVAIALSLVRRARDLAIGIPALILWQIVEGRRFLLKPP